MLAYGLGVFAGAFLLFEAQPILARYILPWFGGGPGVWTTCLLFFQVVLLAGYAYAHLLTRLGRRAQVAIHLLLVATSLALLPITPSAAFKPAGPDAPVLRIVMLLLATVGIQAFTLAATGPLLQRWFSLDFGSRSPYRLYAVSNLGSLAALLAYPVLVEPLLSRRWQSWVWSAGFVVFAAFIAWCAVRLLRGEGPDLAGPTQADARDERKFRVEAVSAGRRNRTGIPGGSAAAADPSLADRILWFLLSACGSLLLLAVTNQLCLDVAVIPFLWVLPLSLYLISFTLAFHDPRWYPRALFFGLLQAGMAAEVWILARTVNKDASVAAQVLVHSSVLFVCCMVCHGELARLKPAPRRLTSFYLTIAAGGATGGAFVTLLAPLIFRGYFELHVGLVLTLLLLLAAAYRDPGWILYRGRPLWAWVPLAALVIALSANLRNVAHERIGRASEVTRNFYGVLAVSLYDPDEPEGTRLILTHGSTLHGLQFVKPEKRRFATSYYGPDSGVGIAMRRCQERGAVRVGAIGLGIGTVAAYGRPGDTFRFYEINPEVKRLAETAFTYLSDSPARVEVVLGDARVSLEREEPQRFDLLVLDAFSSDAVPVHLLTKEAFEIYQRHLAPNGILAVHISNAYLDLRPVVFGQADHLGLPRVLVSDIRAKRSGGPDALRDALLGVESSFWVLSTRDTEFLESDRLRRGTAALETEFQPIDLWSDDWSNLLQLVRRPD